MEHPIADATPDNIFGLLSSGEFYSKHQVRHHEAFMTNSRGMQIFTQKWEPINHAIRAVVLVIHGFSVDSSWVVQLTAVAIAKRGFSVHAFDFEGHGRSEGLVAHVPDLNTVADDCIQFSEMIKQQQACSSGDSKLPFLVYAESLGAAVALLVHLRQPRLYEGAVLHGAMCGISPKFLPPWPVVKLASLAARLIPTWRVCPTPDNVVVSYKEPWKRRLVKSSPYKIAARADAATGYDMLRVSAFLQSRLHLISLPFLALHGQQDTVCDVECVRALYLRASSLDKFLQVYPGMWHMFVGESKDLTDLVLTHILAWLEERADRFQQASPPH